MKQSFKEGTMWVDRRVLHIRAGRIPDAIALMKEWPAPEDTVSRRLLKPRTGAGCSHILVVDRTFESLDAADAQYREYIESTERGPLYDRWFEMNEHRGIHELYTVELDEPSQDPSGMWLSRRVAHIQMGKYFEAIDLLNSVPRLNVKGQSRRLLVPRAHDLTDSSLVVIETTAASIDEYANAYRARWQTEEGRSWLAEWGEVATGQSSLELFWILAQE